MVLIAGTSVLFCRFICVLLYFFLWRFFVVVRAGICELISVGFFLFILF